MSRRILRLPAVLARTGDSKSTIRRKELAGQFPRRVQTGPNSVGWFEDEVDAYLEGLPRKYLAGAYDQERIAGAGP
jgi:prophage regulatory protein